GHVGEGLAKGFRHRCVDWRQLGLRAPQQLAWLQWRQRRAVGGVARTDDLADEPLVAAAQQMPAPAAAALDQSRHRSAEEVIRHLGGAAEPIRTLAVPDRQQQVAMAGNEHAGLPVLAIALWSVATDA